METLLQQMINLHPVVTSQDKRNAIKEVIQEIVLCGLSRVGFFKEAAFYGGTALRIFYGLDRFSEDLDFSLRAVNRDFSFEKYIPGLKEELASYGLNLVISTKEKSRDSSIKSAFVKGDTKELVLSFFPDDVLATQIGQGELVKVKFEVDIEPPPYAQFETKYKQLPIPYEVTLYDLPSLFAGKIHAVLCRSWQKRVKGRDLYDFAFYIARRTPVNLKHLTARLVDSGFLPSDQELTLSDLKIILKDRFKSIDFPSAKEDVLNFIRNPNQVELWSESYFNSLTDELTTI